ncbi:MAG: hypothetical protein R6W78_07855 [Bacteroidales bacterium]
MNTYTRKMAFGYEIDKNYYQKFTLSAFISDSKDEIFPFNNLALL